jgi:hypothetical protein
MQRKVGWSKAVIFGDAVKNFGALVVKWKNAVNGRIVDSGCVMEREMAGETAYRSRTSHSGYSARLHFLG